ncbi:nucleotide exchange factor GrpE [Kamptonema cortianum]|nr:nucleotide exchange factor GrpE [Geitlerinema splendidum]MDK3158392.1 nucleotide exchange factor GrpE [Kamptonema cortianum]
MSKETEPAEIDATDEEPTDSKAEGSGESGQSTDSAIEQRDQMIELLKKELDFQKDAMLRAMAEAQNIQRRMRQQFEQEKKFATEGLIREIIPVLDNFDRTLRATENGSSLESVREGMEVINRQLRKALSSVDLVQIESVGAKFDPELHEAIVTIESDDTEPDTVVDEIESGYRIGDRVLRPARVRVSKAREE